jgi:hypothetical protein
MPQSQPKPETETPGFRLCTLLVYCLTEDSQRRGVVGRITGRFDAANLTGRRQGHFVAGRCLVRLADDFRLSELDACEKLLERAFRYVLAAVFASTLPQRLIENDVRFVHAGQNSKGESNIGSPRFFGLTAHSEPVSTIENPVLDFYTPKIRDFLDVSQRIPFQYAPNFDMACRWNVRRAPRSPRSRFAADHSSITIAGA